jgi:deoxyribonuclease V
MNLCPLHGWDLTPTAAVALQRELACRVEMRTPLTKVELIAGADVSYARFSSIFYAGIVVLRADDMSIVESQGVVRRVKFPYVPGLLSFRESPVLLEAFDLLKTRPDVLMMDGQGFAHPRRFGIACHLGLWLDLPTIGCAKSLLIGEPKEPKPKAGSVAPLLDKGDVIGKVVRTRTGVKPVYVSVGHRVDLASAVRIVLKSCRGRRIPEPTRQAHLFVNQLRTASRER